jgi:hypothetical protein
VIKSRPNWDAAYYGRPVTSRDVLFGHVSSAQATPLRREIDAFG